MLWAALGPHCCTWAFSSWGEGATLGLQDTGFSLLWLLFVAERDSRAADSVVVHMGLVALCPGDLPGPRVKPCPPALQGRLEPLDHQGSPMSFKDGS